MIVTTKRGGPGSTSLGFDIRDDSELRARFEHLRSMVDAIDNDKMSSPNWWAQTCAQVDAFNKAIWYRANLEQGKKE